VKTDVYAGFLASVVDGCVADVSTGEQMLPFDVKKNPTYQAVEKTKAVIRDLAAGRRTIGLASGGTGMGKTTLTRQICHHHLIKHVPEDRPANASALVSVTWANRMYPVHVLNECDSLLRDEQALNVLKLMHEEPRRCALWTKEGRRNEEFLETGSKQYRESIPPTSFEVGRLCRQLFTLNLNYCDPAITRELPQEHWRALIRRGLNPTYIPTDDLYLFQYVVWLGGEGRMLRSLQFDYATSRDAIEFYCRHINRLPEISPARLVMIAEVIRDNPNRDRRAEALDNMLLATDQRPSLILGSMVQVLLWPRKPPRRRPKPRQDRPAAPPEQATAAPEPEPVTETPPEPEPAPTVDDVLDVIYGRRQEETCESIADVLRHVPMAEWDYPDDFDRLAEGLQNIADWQGDHYDLACSYMVCAPGRVLFVTAQGVVVWHDGLQIYSWEDAAEQIEPQMQADAEERDLERRKKRWREITARTLPEKRKLKAMLALIDELVSLNFEINDKGLRAIEFIRSLRKDDPRFAECKTWNDYIMLAITLTEQVTETRPEPEPPKLLLLPAPDPLERWLDADLFARVLLGHVPGSTSTEWSDVFDAVIEIEQQLRLPGFRGCADEDTEDDARLIRAAFMRALQDAGVAVPDNVAKKTMTDWFNARNVRVSSALSEWGGG
jgi:hypothetical protein